MLCGISHRVAHRMARSSVRCGREEARGARGRGGSGTSVRRACSRQEEREAAVFAFGTARVCWSAGAQLSRGLRAVQVLVGSSPESPALHGRGRGMQLCLERTKRKRAETKAIVNLEISAGVETGLVEGSGAVASSTVSSVSIDRLSCLDYLSLFSV